MRPKSTDRSVACIASVSAMAVAAALLSAAPGALAADNVNFETMLAQNSPPVVTIKYVLKTQSRWGSSDDESECTGVLVGADGLVMCSKTELGGFAALWGRGSSSTPTDIKILVGDDIEGLDAEIVARDSELDLTWMRIKEPGDREFPHIDLNESAVPQIGDLFYVVDRMDKYFDRVAVVQEGRIGGTTRKPRKLHVPTTGGGSLGLPVYDAQGKIIGVPIHLVPDREELQSAPQTGGGWGLILPAEDVAKATQRAREIISELDKEE